MIGLRFLQVSVSFRRGGRFRRGDGKAHSIQAIVESKLKGYFAKVLLGFSEAFAQTAQQWGQNVVNHAPLPEIDLCGDSHPRKEAPVRRLLVQA